MYSGLNSKKYTPNVNVSNHNLVSQSSIKQSPASSSSESSPASSSSSQPKKVNSVKINQTLETLSAWEVAKRYEQDDETDYRPRVLDGNTKSLTLIDSGSQCTVVQPDPGDVPDPSIKLESVGGTPLPCYGKKKISIRIGRKEFHITAMKAKVNETILGWDFVSKYRFDFVWSEFGDVYLVS